MQATIAMIEAGLLTLAARVTFPYECFGRTLREILNWCVSTAIEHMLKPCSLREKTDVFSL